jgi:hypothetical protein
MDVCVKITMGSFPPIDRIIRQMNTEVVYSAVVIVSLENNVDKISGK